MKTELELNEMILNITNKIRKSDPELLKCMNEMPITVPYSENPEITTKTLTSYYDSLVALVDEYENNKSKNIVSSKVDIIPTTEIKTMELNNSFHDLIVEVKDLKISYNDVGEGSIPILFLHGFPFDKSMWIGQLDNLKSMHRLIAIDIRGFGKSTDEKTPLSINLFADDLISFMDKLNIKKAIVCGLSMGGFISLNAVKRFPERFEALILCDTQCIADTPEVKKKRYITIDQINAEGVNAFNEKFIKSVFHPKSLNDKKEIVENITKVVFANTKEIITAGLTALAERSETCSSLAEIKIPTLIICGREDEVTPLAQSEFMQNNIEDAVLKIINDAGHVSNLEHPDEFNSYILDFLNSIKSISK